MKPRTGFLVAILAAAVLLSAALPVCRILVWNATASLPTGLYYIRGQDDLQIGERVAIDPPPGLRRFLAARGYLPSGVPLLKQVAAMRGDRVCRAGRSIAVNGVRVGQARWNDSRGRALPVWQGCQVLAADEIFVMNLRAPGSFDGRYFGPVKHDRVIGRASPVWTDEGAEGALVWFARPDKFRSPTDNQGDQS